MFQITGVAAADRVNVAFTSVWEGLGRPGQNLTSKQRIAVAEIAREASPRPLWEQPPDLFTENDEPDPGGGLSPFRRAVVERVAVESRSLSGQIVAGIMGRIGDATYAEIVAIVAQVVPIDHFMRAVDIDLATLPMPGEGEPTGHRPEDLGDIGGFIAMTDPYDGPNVARSLSLAGGDNDLRLRVVRSMYSGTNFGEMVWADRALTRPQIELVAARTSALNECFY